MFSILCEIHAIYYFLVNKYYISFDNRTYYHNIAYYLLSVKEQVAVVLWYTAIQVVPGYTT